MHEQHRSHTHALARKSALSPDYPDRLLPGRLRFYLSVSILAEV